jgi:hypothetical protein
MQNFFLITMGYVAIVFPLALIWHLALFKQNYVAFGYFRGDPNLPIGLLTITIQGIALALIYPYFQSGLVGWAHAFQFAGLIGLFFWTSHVLALVAKQNVPNSGSFVFMETGYLMLQYGLFALWLGFLHQAP